jgi:hypothetical protein
VRSKRMTFEFRRFAGRYRLVVSDTLLAFIERTFVELAPKAERDRIRAEALAEATAAELEIHSDGTIVSRAGAHEFYRVQVAAGGAVSELAFEKAPGVPVTLKLREDGSLLAMQPGKPSITFVRRV